MTCLIDVSTCSQSSVWLQFSATLHQIATCRRQSYPSWPCASSEFLDASSWLAVALIRQWKLRSRRAFRPRKCYPWVVTLRSFFDVNGHSPARSADSRSSIATSWPFHLDMHKCCSSAVLARCPSPSGGICCSAWSMTPSGSASGRRHLCAWFPAGWFKARSNSDEFYWISSPVSSASRRPSANSRPPRSGSTCPFCIGCALSQYSSRSSS